MRNVHFKHQFLTSLHQVTAFSDSLSLSFPCSYSKNIVVLEGTAFLMSHHSLPPDYFLKFLRAEGFTGKL